jgi:hypothetical protein
MMIRRKIILLEQVALHLAPEFAPFRALEG